MSDKKENLVDLAASISDGKEVDWQEVKASGGDDQEARTLGNLKVLDTIIRSHHSLQNGPDDLTAWGPLQIIRHLASGSFGDVYRAYDPALDRDVALKLLRRDTVASHDHCLRLIREGRNLAKVHHENVATIYGAEEHAGRVGIWMELIEGETLDRVAQKQGLAGWEEALIVAITTCRALTAVHGAGQTHGDIKTQNIMREVGGRLVLTDFGSGSCLSDNDSLVSGTPLYLAPEVLNGANNTVSSDIYGVGVLLFHMLTGRFPYEADTLRLLKQAHEGDPMNSLRDLRPGLPRDVIGVVERAMSPDTKVRFSSAGHLERALQQCLGARTPRVTQSRRWIAGILVGVMALATVAILRIVESSPPAYTIEATMYRSNDAGTIAVVSGAATKPHDRIFLQIESSTEVHLYVLNQDDKGAAWILFPLQGQSLVNPLSAGIWHRVPGEINGSPYSWEVTTAGGVEHFLLIASPDPLPELESTIARLAWHRTTIGALPLDATALEVFRGVGGVIQDQPVVEAAPADLFMSVERMISSKNNAQTRGVWVQRIDLTNRGF